MRRQSTINFGVRPTAQDGIRFYNISKEEIPPYYPLVIQYYSPDNRDSASNPFAITGLPASNKAWPMGGNAAANLSYSLINGPNSVAAGSYGTAYNDYPRPLAVDPDSFPIWSGNYSVPPSLGDVADYLATPSNPLFPPVGFSPTQPGKNFQPATFSPQLPRWAAICWDTNADGTQATDRVIAVPWTRPEFPYAGTLGIFGTSFSATPATLIQPFPVLSSGLYVVQVSASVQIDTPGAIVTLKVNYTPGASAPASATVNGAQPWCQGGRQMPNVTVNGQQVTYQSYGAEQVFFSGAGFAFQGDQWSLSAEASEETSGLVSGNMTFFKIGTGTQNTTGSGSPGLYGPYWNGWWGGGYGWGWGWGWGL